MVENTFDRWSPSNSYGIHPIPILLYRGRFFTTTTGILSLCSPPGIRILSSINISGPFVLFGIYYGFLTTLPIGPSQILSIRAFLLEGSLSGLIAICGLSLGQPITFLSIYYSPLYMMLVKPHAMTSPVSPYLLSHWYRTKDLSNHQSLRPIESLTDNRICTLFSDSPILQLLNPVLLPGPILARLVDLSLFRYSHNPLFVSSCFFGWLCGQMLLIKLCESLLLRVEADSPMSYLSVKRIIHRTFSIFIFGSCLSYLGRTPIPLFAKRIVGDPRLNAPRSEESLPPTRVWPIPFFDCREWNRPLRFIGNSRSGDRSPVRERVSQYFFNVCSSDGRRRISFTYLPSPAISRRDFNRSVNSFSSSHSHKNWIEGERDVYQYLYEEFRERIAVLNDGYSFEDAVEKRTGSLPFGGHFLQRVHDPLLNSTFCQTMIIPKSALLSTGKSHESTGKRKLRNFSRKPNKLKNWISDRWKDSDRKVLVLPWEPLAQDARRALSLLINKSRNVKPDTNSQEMNFSDELEVRDGDRRSNYPDLFANPDDPNPSRRKTTRKSPLNWELISNLSPTQRTSYFHYLETERRGMTSIYWKIFDSDGLVRFIKCHPLLGETLQSREKIQIREVDKEVPRWPSNLRNDKFDVIAIGVTDIRQRKVKNLGYLVKGKDRRRKIVRRFSQQSDFRRKLIKGSMRSRRRKTVVWRILQLKIHSPLFLRITQESVLPRPTPRGRDIDLSKGMSIDEKKSFPGGGGISTKRTKADRLAIANRWDFPLAQWGRSWSSIIQSHLRKYFVLPILIISKNISRSLLFQIPEWNRDWYEWNREIHIKCTYDGTEVSEKELPEQWLRDGLQIKMIHPFRLKPWHSARRARARDGDVYPDVSRGGNERDKELHGMARGKVLDYSYLTAWGFQTDLPFGDMRKKNSFWRRIRGVLNKRLNRVFLPKFAGTSPTRGLRALPRSVTETESGNRPGEYRNNYSERSDYEHFFGEYHDADGKPRRILQLIPEMDGTAPPETPPRSGYGTRLYIRELKDLVEKKTNEIERRGEERSIRSGIIRKDLSTNGSTSFGWKIPRGLGMVFERMQKMPYYFIIHSQEVEMELEMSMRFVAISVRKIISRNWD